MSERSLQVSDPKKAQAAYELVAIGTSAGGLAALSAVLQALPPDLDACVLVMQHLGAHNHATVQILDRRCALPVAWAEDGTRIQHGHVFLCPPLKGVEVNPDGSLTLSPSERGALENPISALFESLADSYRERGLAVVLTGMGKDGSAGVRAIKQAGGAVLVQSEETADYPSMPQAAIQTGAVDLVLSLGEIGSMIADLVSGQPLPQPSSEMEAIHTLFAGESEIPRLLREIDWAHSPLGPVSAWPASLCTALRLTLESPVPSIVLWGPDHIQLYNDHYRILMGDKHPSGLGQPNRECWPEVWHLNEPIFTQVRRGIPVALEDALFPITRHGTPEDVWFNLYYTPVRDERGAVAGILATITESTAKVLAARRLAALHDLAARIAGAATVREVLDRALQALETCDQDVPFAIAYLLDASRTRAQLVGAAGVEAGGPLAPQVLDALATRAWPLAEALRAGEPVLLRDLSSRFRGMVAGPQRVMPESALLFPLRGAADPQVLALLVLGVSPRLLLDSLYRAFLELLGLEVAAALTDARSRQREREQLEALATLDRAKTEFFANVSHEFRTPLTLMLAPLEEALRDREQLPARVAEDLDVIARNGRRLLMLVESLLDFSQVQAGRLRAHFEPVDLATFTTDLAGVFRSAVERAGLRFVIDCEPLTEPIWVDVEMWEKIVSNLLSNALKFTFEGEIVVRIRALPKHVELQVCDTGVGIPPEEIPHIFKRFHRVRGFQARTHEGSGIGLALAHELVRLHHGRIRVKSSIGEGTTLTVWLPLGARLPGEAAPREEGAPEAAPREEGAPEAAPRVAASMAEQAMRWIGETDFSLDDPLPLPSTAPPVPARSVEERLLVVDDNADMRDYLARLLAPHWRVETAADGAEALKSIRRDPPDLLLADVMMPGLDGFALLQHIRHDDTLKTLPVILVTARVGEEAAIEGMMAGADDYIAKPFSARELIARVGAQLELSRIRRESEARLYAALAAARMAVWQWDPDTDLLITSDTMNEVFGLLPGETFQSSMQRFLLVHPDDRERHQAMVETAGREGGSWHTEFRILRPRDGQVAWLEEHATTSRDPRTGKIQVSGLVWDITERKRAGEARL